MQAVLVMFRSDGERRSFSVTRDVTVIGRRDDCDLRIPLGDVSRKHARLIRDGDSLRLEDFGSSNGTFLNGQRIQQDAVLQAGDSIQIGPVVFVLQVDGYPADEELNPITSDAAAGGDGGGEFGAAALGAAGGAAVGAAALGLDEDDELAPAGEYAAGGEYAEGGEFDPLGELSPAGDAPTLELGHAGDEGMDLTAPADGGLLHRDGPLAIGEDPLAVGEEPLAIGEDPLALDEDPLAPGGGDLGIPLAGDDGLIGLAEDDYQPIPLAGGDQAADGGLVGEDELSDGGLELTDGTQPADGGGDAGLDDLLIDIEPEPPKKR